MNAWARARAWWSGRPALGALLLFLAVCGLETTLHRHESWLLWFGLGDTTRLDRHSYLGGFHYHDDRDDEPLHAEAVWLADVALGIAGQEGRSVVGGGGADRYRLIGPFAASFPLSWTGLDAAHRLVNLCLWVATCWAAWWTAGRLFGCPRTALLAGLLVATSHALVLLSGDSKAAMFQLAGPFCLFALALHLGHFSQQDDPAGWNDSFLLGLATGLATFASAASFFFLPCLLLYGLLEQPWRVFLRRTAAFGLGCVTAAAPLLVMTRPLPGAGAPALGRHLLGGIDWARWGRVWVDKMTHHFPQLVPWHLWLGLVMLPGLGPRRRLFACALASLATTEALMLTASEPYFDWTIGYYYLQPLFWLYLLDALLLARLLFPGAERPRWQRALARGAGLLFLALTLLSSNLALLGNRWFQSTFARRTSTQVLLHSWCWYDNLDRYRRER